VAIGMDLAARIAVRMELWGRIRSSDRKACCMPMVCPLRCQAASIRTAAGADAAGQKSPRRPRALGAATAIGSSGVFDDVPVELVRAVVEAAAGDKVTR